ncbi:hypothetical protein DQW50_14580 [Halorubrum sp. 48-1-W]|uniref:hypothetical protein n=1 Tax=Halorubrum sp. 48-1-W TaxID=2249761 RepID=UPI000DCDACED|nr:hypothetical protein [Halorubrum sp. 48-1-W]RAW44383.1 hypothetical protein DQW50_14580 [Halorubrum sp. 48-1-W]
MPEIELGVPRGVIESLPEGEDTAERDMRRAIAGIQSRLNEEIDGSDPAEAAAVVVDAIERMEEQASTYHEFVPELRAWGQSPIYAIAWRNLYVELIGQLYDHEWLAGELDRERNFRLVDDGIRLSDL